MAIPSQLIESAQSLGNTASDMFDYRRRDRRLRNSKSPTLKSVNLVCVFATRARRAREIKPSGGAIHRCDASGSSGLSRGEAAIRKHM
jgi:hypothetical protein